MNTTNIKNKVIWEGRSIRIKDEHRKWYQIFDAGAGLLVNLIIFGSVVFAAYNIVRNGIGLQTLLFLTLVILLFLALDILIKLRFKNSSYVLTQDNLEIRSWRLLGGNKRTVVDLNSISKTYLIGATENIGTLLLYSNKSHERSRDLMSGSRLESTALQCIADPRHVKKLIDKQRVLIKN